MSWLLLFTISELVVGLAMAWVVIRRRRPAVVALAWLMLVFLNPYVGLVLYMLIGVSRLGRYRAEHHRHVAAHARRRHDLQEMHAFVHRPQFDGEQRNMILQAERMSGNPIVAGNDVELLPTNEDFIARLVEDIDAAKHHAHLLYYIFRPDDMGRRIADALIRAAGRGVRCRLVADSAGSLALFHASMAGAMQQAGVQVIAALPAAPWRRKLSRIDLRNHRKIAVIDGRYAYTGSHNVVMESYGHKRGGRWIDLSGRFTGPVVAQLQSTFLQDWEFETGQALDDEDLFPSLESAGDIAAQVVPTDPSHEAESFRRVLLAALNAARHRIIMTTPYLVLDDPTMLALAMAADRGVETTIVVPRKSDHRIVDVAGRSYFEPLLEAGVNLQCFRDGLLHAKTITVDDAFALVGSANLDIRSFQLNFEINVLLYGAQVTHQLRFAQHRYLAESDPLDLDQWRRRPALHRYVENAAALLSPLL